MDAIHRIVEGQRTQYHLDDDLMLANEVFNQKEGTMAQLDDDLMPSDDAFNRSQDTTQAQNDSMLLDDDIDARQDSLFPFSDFEDEIPHYLPENALLTGSCSIAHADGKQETYITVHNTPRDNYVAQKINDGNEFAIGGDPSHILKSLDREFKSHRQQRWHVIVIAEDNLQLTGVPRRSYPLVSGMGEICFPSEGEGAEALQHCKDSESMMNNGAVNAASQEKISRILDGHIRDSSRLDEGPAFGVATCKTAGQFRQNGSIDSMMVAVNNEHTYHPFNHQEAQNSLSYRLPQLSSIPRHMTPVQDHGSQLPAFLQPNKRRQLHQDFVDQREEEEKQKREDALIIAADDRFESYTGTNLCRWCGRRGHEALQCIKWDPQHFDKLVCIVCNNKKHLLDDCLRFEVMSEEAKVKLVLVDGANRPGARSFFWPWTQFVNVNENSTTDILPTATALPMTRGFIKRLTSTERGRNLWGNLWKTFPYGGCEVPAAFQDKELVLDGLDECFDAHWPLMPQAGEHISVSPAQQQ